MAFVITTHQQSYVEVGRTRMTAVLELTNTSDQATGTTAQRVSLIMGDTSGSMAGAKIIALRQAMRAAVDVLPEHTEFALCTFSSGARRLFPRRSRRAPDVPDVLPATLENKRRAQAAVEEIQEGGGTVMSAAIALVQQVAQSRPGSITHCLFLTDGKNESNTEELVQEVERAQGAFQCDVRIVGDGAHVDYMRTYVATPLLGQVKVIRDAADMAEEFRATITTVQDKAIGNVYLALRCPRTAKIIAVTETVPQKLDLAGTLAADGRTWLFRTAPWAPGESRDYLLTLEVVPLPGREDAFASMTAAGREMQLAIPSIRWSEAGGEHVVESAPVVMAWTDDVQRSARFDLRVAHATGQVEVVQDRQKAVEALRQGDYEAATRHFQRVMDYAIQQGNAAEIEDTTRALRRIGVEVQEQGGTHTIRVQRQVAKVDLDDFDARSTVTKRFGTRR
jgi:hypothetical protein